jgi:hypothetical protein
MRLFLNRCQMLFENLNIKKNEIEKYQSIIIT